ncbi:hypothetical protein DFH08DRAFT_990424 [Mycena albidolilacea]|uniref:Uncharacterized protein n=1 Tax=Mycena albidolilacea TaxID=1033008 RepID=A0AAD7A8W5_9AGAR|nr:hypothetical protein DFH08DRAFT_990424 [Mycena albidolilacea]
MSLGMLEPGSKYDRDGFENGTIQCATCHLGYFTGGFLVFSPPLPVLEWIIQQLDSLKPPNADSVWKIFRSLEEEDGPDCNRFHHLYSLIPRFQAGGNAPAAEWYDIYCDLPPIHSIHKDGKFKPSKPGHTPRNGPRVRIFDFDETLKQRKQSKGVRPNAGTIRLFPPGTKDKDAVNNYWRLPVPCHVILFVFIEAVGYFKFEYSIPEVAKAMNIYRRLRNIRDENDRDENGGLRHSWNGLGGRRHLHEPRAPPSSSSPARTPKHMGCRHPMKYNSPKYCAQCWTLSPSNFPPIDTLPTDVSDIASSHIIRTAPGRPSIPAISYESAKAYPTPSSLPPPERESESAVDYFTGTSSRTSPPSAAFSAAAFDTPTPGPRSFRLRTLPTQSSLASISSGTNSSSRSDLISKSTSTTFADSDEDPDYLPEESGGEANDTTEEDSDDAQGDGDSLSEALSQEGSEDGLE